MEKAFESAIAPDTLEYLKRRILVLNEKVWEYQLSWTKVESWLANFTGRLDTQEREQLHALFWLSQFMYFGSKEIRVLLRALYRDLFLIPLIHEIRSAHPTLDLSQLADSVVDELHHTRFLGIGNPSESGVHLLYYFRQENLLGKSLFIDAVQIFQRATPKRTKGFVNCLSKNRERLRNPSIRRYIFVDDVCGSGNTALDYSEEILEPLVALSPQAQFSYLCLFASANGLNNVRQNTLFGANAAAVYELDESYRCLSGHSRYLKALPADIDPAFACQLAREYGAILDPDYGCGFEDGQLLIGFHHNTPDNTLPILWHDSAIAPGHTNWTPIFKRYPKIYGVGP